LIIEGDAFVSSEEGFNTNGFTTSATNNIVLRAAAGAEFDGTPVDNGGSGAKLLLTSGVFRPSVPHISVEGLEIESAIGSLVNVFAADVTFKNCYLNGEVVSGTTEVIYSATRLKLQNCVLITSGRGCDARGDSGVVFNNLTVIGKGSATFGLLTDSNTTTRNTVSVGFGSECIFGVPGTNLNNATEDGSIGATITTAAFTDYASGDYTPASGGALDGAGTDLSAFFTDDITGTTRTQWDIGAYAVVSGGGGTTVEAGVQQIAVTAHAAQVLIGTALQAALTEIDLTAHPASVSLGAAISADAEQIDLTPHTAAVSLGRLVDAGAAQIELTPHPATVDLGTAIGAQVQAISLTAHPADVSLGTALQAALQSIEVSTAPAQISTGSAIGAQVQQIVLAPHQATVQQGTSLAAALQQIAVTAHAANVQTGSGINAQAQQIALETFPAGVEVGITIAGSLHQISVEALASTVGLGDQVDAFAHAIELTPHGATLTLGTALQADAAQIQVSTFRATVTAGVAPLSIPGLEFTLPADRMHFALPISRIHFTFTDEDR
jgi:hypothetical protein